MTIFSFGQKGVDRLARSIAPDNPHPQRDGWLKTAFEHAPIGIAVATLDGKCLRINDACCQLLGYKRDELLHFSLNDLTHPEDAAKELVLIRRVLAGDTNRYRLQKRFMDKRSAYRPLLVSAALAKGAAGSPDVFVYVIETFESTVESGQDAGRLAITVLEQLQDVAIIRTDSKGMITGWNNGAEKILGYRRDEVVGKNRRVLYRDQDSWTDEPHNHLRMATERGHHSFEDFRVARDGTHVWLRNTITAFAPNGTVRGFIEVLSAADSGVKAIDIAPAIEQLSRELDQLRQAHGRALEENEQLKRRSDASEQELQILGAALREESARRSEAEGLNSRGSQDLGTETGLLSDPSANSSPLELPLAHAQWNALDGSRPRDLLIDAALSRRTGAMILADILYHKVLFFEDGRLTCIASDDPADFLGERLVLKGTITGTQRNKALELARTTDLAFGRCLVILGFMSDSAVREAIRAKIEDDIEDLCSWKNCSWSFVDREPPHRKLLQLSIDISQLRAIRATAIVPSSEDDLIVPELFTSDSILLSINEAEQREVVSESGDTPAGLEVTSGYIATQGGSRFHEQGCPSIRRVSEEQRVLLPHRQAAEERGLEPCRTCLRRLS